MIMRTFRIKRCAYIVCTIVQSFENISFLAHMYNKIKNQQNFFPVFDLILHTKVKLSVINTVYRKSFHCFENYNKI